MLIKSGIVSSFAVVARRQCLWIRDSGLRKEGPEEDVLSAEEERETVRYLDLQSSLRIKIIESGLTAHALADEKYKLIKLHSVLHCNLI